MGPQIKYSFMKYCCIHGGQKFKYKGFGKRQTSTCKNNCPFYLHFQALEDGQTLILQDLNNTHNHKVSEPSLDDDENEESFDNDEIEDDNEALAELVLLIPV
ncbi:uncharacterized protein LOC124810560 [Hydra vulgaris]|uniref:uncharacterized protein LOC124810560 n=1 Tax=Hydra vulgaris TaxID=6087 RepID=UPI0032E9EDCD